MSEGGSERFYHRLSGADMSATSPWAIRCPECDVASEIDPPEWECEHCGTKLALFVGSWQKSCTERGCLEANGGERDAE